MTTNLLLPDPPRVDMFDARGKMSRAWQRFFQDLYIRTGRNIEYSNTEIALVLGIPGLVANRMLATDANARHVSVLLLSAFFQGVADKITVTDIAGGKLQITLPPSILLSGATANRLLATDSDKKTASVANLAAWIAGTADKITVADDLDGTITLTLPGSILLSSATASRLLATDANKKTVSIDLASWIAGTTNQVTVTDDADGSVTLSLPDYVHVGGLVLAKDAGKGIKVDHAAPTFGWADILGEVKVLSPGANDPTLAVFRDSLRQFSFSNAVMNEVFGSFHIPHDYVPGSDVYIHVHWAQNVVDTGGPAAVPGDVKWQFEVSYSKGHNQAAFPASFTTSVTQTASGTQYQHLIAEVQLSAAAPSAVQIDSDLLEPDGIILVRAFRDPTDAADTLDQVPFLHYVDLHYQSTGRATKQKSPDFNT